MSAPIVRTRGLTKRFGDFVAVDHLDVEVAPGSIFAFLGANGSGKSTTIRMLIGLLRPTEGTIEVDGIDVIRRPHSVRERIGYMGQKVSLYQGLSLRENVEFYAGLFGLSGAALEQRWGALRERFSLAGAEREQAEDLPAGVRQRAGLALATLHRPRLLFLDEPTAGVDVLNRTRFWEFIREEAGMGATVFVTTHFLEEVEYCNWVTFIDGGRLVANAAPETLREQYGDGYRVTLEIAAERRAGVGARLHELGLTATASDGGFVLTLRRLEPPQLRMLDHLASAESGLRLAVEQAPMTDVFRRVLSAKSSVE